MTTIQYIDEVDISNKRVLLRADFDVSLNPDFTIADDARIRQNIPTIKYLLEKGNKLICVAKLDRPKGRDPKYSLRIVVDKLKEHLPGFEIVLVDDFLTYASELTNQQPNQIIILENIRFYPQEKANDLEFAKHLAKLADIYVNDAFAMCHREEASVVGVPKLIPGYGGLLLKKEVQTIQKAVQDPPHPFTAILGGAKISTKIELVGKLMELSDHLLIGGGLANIFLLAKGFEIGESFCEQDFLPQAMKLIEQSKHANTQIVLPSDVVVGTSLESTTSTVKKVSEIAENEHILDIGPETQAEFGSIIAKSKTVVWNGPQGYIENPTFRRGTDFVYYSITHTPEAISVVGGGDTLAAISKKEYLDKITHISTGGGAMLAFIEKGTLPGIEALHR